MGEANTKHNAAIRAAAGWLPIESAPKTGCTLLLGYWNSHGKWRTVRGQWMSAEYIAEYWEEPDDAEEGWFETAVEAEEVPNCWRTTPSHWQPLPAAPGVSTVEDAGAHKIVIDFDQVGSAGPFYVFDGRVTIPAVTVMDLVRMAAPAAGDALDAARWRSFRSAITRQDLDWLERMDTALLDMGCDVDSENPPSDAQVDAAADAAIAAQQGREES